MKHLTQIRARLRALFSKRRLEAEMAAEMRAHLEMQEQANRAATTGCNGGLGFIDARILD